ncbi:MAG: hypothetical protein AB7P03_15425 [Kofleriaceae bacterium]
MRSTLILLVLAALGSGCGPATIGYSASVSASTPDLVAIGPGTYVIADYDEPIFYSNGYYWRNYEGYWYRSPSYISGWVQVYRPPITISRIQRPWSYRHYRPHGYVYRRRPVPSRQLVAPRHVDRSVRRDIDRRPVIRRHRR